MASSTKSKNRLLTECQIAKQELTAHRQAQQLRNEKARIQMATKRAELKMRSPEEQQLYAEKARTSQAKYREKHRERLAMEQGRRRMFAYGSIYGTKQMSLWVQKLAEKRERKEATRECRVRRLRCEVRAAAKTAARAPTPSDSEADESDDNRSDDEAQASE